MTRKIHSLRKIQIIIVVGAVLSFSQVQSTAQTYFVATDGDDGYSGSFDRPWKTIQKAADTVGPGSTVYVRGGVYSENVSVNVSGTASSGYITFANYENEIPILDGTGLAPGYPSGLFLIADKNHIVIRGFEIRNYRSDSRDVPIGIHVRGACHHIELRNNRIHHIETAASDGNAHGICVFGTRAPDSVHDIIIRGNELYNLTLGASEALVLNGNVESFTVTENIVRDCDNIGIDIIGFEGISPDPDYDQARNGVVSRNTVYNISSYGNPAYGNAYSAGGIYIDGGRDTVVERNTVYLSDIGIEIASEHQNRATRNIVVRNNVLYQNRLTGLAMGGYDTNRGSTEDCAIVNNTLYHNNTLQDWNGEILIQYDVKNNIVKNNILFAGQQGLFFGNIFTQNTNNTVDFNLYYAASGTDGGNWQWKNAMYTGFDTYRSATGNDANSVFARPELADPTNGNHHLRAISPAIGAGEELAEAGSVDMDGEPRNQGGGIDIGADEYLPGVIGDIDGNGTVAINDAILGLKVLSEISATIHPDFLDVNGDDRIGLAEIIYAIRKSAKITP